LTIDGNEVVASRVRNEMAQGSLMLEAGLHDVVMRYADRTDHTYINLTWRPPGNDPMLRNIPSELLFPPQENFEKVDVADLARFVQGETIMPTEVVRGDIDPARVDVMASGLSQPRGVAVGNGVVYVAETGNRRVIAIDAETGELVASPFDAIVLAEPFDLVVQPDGAIVVLDAGTGQLLRYDPVAGVIEAIPVSKEFVERSRGIGAGQSGEIWIANTPGQRIAAFDASGALLQEVALPAVAADGKEMQPIDIERMSDNTLYVTDVAQHMLYRFSLAGFLLSSQPIPVANSLDGAHLAADAAGALYMTEPEAGRVVRLDANGIVDRIWSVRVAEAQDAKAVGIGVAADGAIWVADSQGGRVLRITPESAE
jgi:sugar lactone lactonase YvrE